MIIGASRNWSECPGPIACVLSGLVRGGPVNYEILVSAFYFVPAFVATHMYWNLQANDICIYIVPLGFVKFATFLSNSLCTKFSMWPLELLINWHLSDESIISDHVHTFPVLLSTRYCQLIRTFQQMDVYLDKDFVSPFIHPLASRLVLATDLAGHEQLLPWALGGTSLCHSMGIRFHSFANIHALELQ